MRKEEQLLLKRNSFLEKELIAKNRELEIETSLETVRAAAMAMQSSADLKEVVKTLFEELRNLDVNLQACLIATFDPVTCDQKSWIIHRKTHEPYCFLIPGNEQPFYQEMLKAWKERNANWSYMLEGEAKRKWEKFLFTDTDFKLLPKEVKEEMSKPKKVFFAASYYQYGAIQASSPELLSKASIDILQRFSKVFDSCYTRFLDLKKAEAQVRESQIQLALERVRAKTMAMQKPSEFVDVINIIGEQFMHLGFDFDWVNFSASGLDVSKAIDIWNFVVVPGLYQGATRLVIPFFEHPVFKKAEESVKEYYTTGNSFTVVLLDKKDKDSFLDHLFTNTIYKDLPEEVKTSQYDREVYQTSNVVLKDTWLSVGKYDAKPLTDEQIGILKRLANEFGQAYTRFLDLQKAEEQAREVQIQLALERVRARTLAMHKSEELPETSQVLFHQLLELGDMPDRIAICIVDETLGLVNFWLTDQIGTGISNKFKGRISESTVIAKQYKAWKEQAKSMVIDLRGKELNEWIQFVREEMGILVKDNKIKNSRVHTSAFFSHGWIMVTTNQQQTTETIAILERFASVFNLTYRRFLDLQKAEAQAREAQIQLALERVRARTMAMQKSNELLDIIIVVSEELQHLGIKFGNVSFGVNNPNYDMQLWMAVKGYPKAYRIEWTFLDNPGVTRLMEAQQHPKKVFTDVLTQKENNEWLQHIFSCNPALDIFTDESKSYLLNTPGYARSIIIMKDIFLVIGNYAVIPYSDVENEIFKRFANAFEQTYSRFLDLQKAEEQAREAQIEAGLERVRSRAMGMQTSEELNALIGTVFTELTKLDFILTRCVIEIYEGSEKGCRWWMANSEAPATPMNFFVKYANMAFFDEYLKGWHNRSLKWQYILEGDNKIKTDDFLFNETDLSHLPAFVIEGMRAPDRVYLNASFNNFGNLTLASLEPLSDEHFDIMLRFAKVFDLTYTRFNDLKQAEAQAREASIEAGLERVRSRAMAMQSSEELAALIGTVFTELTRLDLALTRCVIWIFNPETNGATWWMANSEDAQNPINCDLPYNPFEPYLVFLEQWQKRAINFQYELSGAIKKEWDDYLFSETGLSHLPPVVIAGMKAPERVFLTASFNNFGAVNAATLEPLSDNHLDVLLRFAKLFDLTYTRFNDLKQAEARAREARIEASLERVRGKAMAMHSSQDLSDTIGRFYQELKSFSLTPMRCGVGLLDKEERIGEMFTWNTTEQGEGFEVAGRLKMEGHNVLNNIYESWLQQREYHPVLRGDEIKEYSKVLKPQINFPDTTRDDVLFGYFFFFQEGGVYAWTEKEMQEDELQIYRRFTSVLSLTYKRYRDLEKAESNAKEAVKQAALDRIRADIASMRTITDLDRITPLIWNELTILGVPFIRCGVFIMDDEQQQIHTFLSTPEGKGIAAFHLPYNTSGRIAHVISYWQKKEVYTDHWDEKAFKEFADSLVKEGAMKSSEQYVSTMPAGGFNLHFVPFQQGMLYVGNIALVGEEEIDLLQSIADAFSTAYARYEDFNKLEAAKKQVDNTLTELKQAQQQLVQSEKMASLGELTAGIAHEIQNPLNFVNNFSDVNSELIAEMEIELQNGNVEEAITIANDIKENEEKINHHGKRADAIVKGMLQHSRKSSGQKEPTDINALADEYLRLSFHGLRAKDKNFNATIETDFDKSIEKIGVIPQDIGRVFLNLFNNAFYAVNARLNESFGQGQKSSNPVSYNPTVSVKTEKCDDKIFVTVRDNGNGIPQKILDKIFQPFFTTKPTGQGTGLGLSLSYDIIKAHGGEIKVKSEEGKGTMFIVQLPF